MAIEKRVTVKDITGAPLAIDLIRTDGNLSGVRIVTEDGEYIVDKTASYSETLRITTAEPVKYEPRWNVSGFYKDDSISSRVFKDLDVAKEFAADLKTDRFVKKVRLTEDKVVVNDDGDAVTAPETDEIPF